MSYEPTNWKTGDVVTSTKLNHMEQGIAAAMVMYPVNQVNIDGTFCTDKTWNEISAAYQGGLLLYLVSTMVDGEITYNGTLPISGIGTAFDNDAQKFYFIQLGSLTDSTYYSTYDPDTILTEGWSG